MKKSLKTVNVMLFICMLVLVITAMLHHDRDLGKLHGLLGLFYIVLIVIHIKQHWGWVKGNLLGLGIKER